MSEIITKLVVDLSKPEGDPDRVQSIPLTAEELAEREIMQQKAAEEQVAREAAATALATLKASAKAKLIAGEPMTEQEATLLLG